MYRIYFLATFILTSCALFGSNVDNLKYSVIKKPDSNKYYQYTYWGPNIYAIDTGTMELEGHYLVSHAQFGGVVRLPQGGVAATIQKIQPEGKGVNKLYIINSESELEKQEDILFSPQSPKVSGDYLVIGSSYYMNNTDFPIWVFDVKPPYNVVSKISSKTLYEGWKIPNQQDPGYYYFGSTPDKKYGVDTVEFASIKEYSSDMKFLREFSVKDSRFREGSFIPLRIENKLYIFKINAGNQAIYKTDLEGNVLAYADTTDLKLSHSKARYHEFFVDSKMINGELYTVITGQKGYDTPDQGRQVAELAIIDTATLKIKWRQELATPDDQQSYAFADNIQFLANKLYIQYSSVLHIYDLQGKLLKKLSLPDASSK